MNFDFVRSQARISHVGGLRDDLPKVCGLVLLLFLLLLSLCVYCIVLCVYVCLSTCACRERQPFPSPRHAQCAAHLPSFLPALPPPGGLTTHPSIHPPTPDGGDRCKAPKGSPHTCRPC